jgi:hypothetical protein
MVDVSLGGEEKLFVFRLMFSSFSHQTDNKNAQLMQQYENLLIDAHSNVSVQNSCLCE